MTQDPAQRRWERVAALVDAALEQEPAERARYLEEACAGEGALRAEVEALLAGAWAPSFLDSGALIFAAPLLKATVSSGESPGPERNLEETTELLRVLAREHAGDLAGFSVPPESAPTERGLSYKLERKLGRGGMATVYLAHDAKHDRRVAVKVLHAELTACLGAQRFVQEIRLTARLQHPHVLGLLDSGVFGPEAGALCGRPYYVMPYLERESLRARLARGGSLAVGEAVRVLREVADALCYAHEQGVVHRDIKPENILLSRDHAVVADFGIAKALFASQTSEAANHTSSGTTGGTLTQLGTLLGTPAYMAPEQAAGEEQVDHRADLYAWGVVAYELLAGRHPFWDRMSPHELATAHMHEMPRPLREVAPAVPLALAALVMRCLAKAPAERPSSGAEIVSTLDTVAVTTASAVAPRLGSSRPVRPRKMAALVVLLLLGAVGTSTYWRSARRDSQRGIATDGSAAQRMAVAASAAALAVVVTGTGEPAIDVPAVQAAVDQGGDVILKGHFSFGTPPTKPVAPLLASGWYPPAAEVLVLKAVTIFGARDAHGEMTTIEAGTIPFYVNAPGERVTIRGLRFVRPIAVAILVYAVRGVEIASCRIEGVVPFAGGSEGIAINTRGEIPMPASPGNPENVSGHLLIARNDIDAVGGTAHDATTGVLVFGVGQSPNDEVDLDIIGNDIRNTTGSTINIRRVNGRVRVLGNTLRTSHEVAIGGNDAVRLVNTGSYLMANNSIECKWADAAGIAVFSQFAEWPMERAIVEDNDVLMSPPPGTVFGDFSAGINVRGFAHGIVVRHNRIRGRARAALAVYVFRGGAPTDNAFINNRFDHFEAALAHIFVGSGVLMRRIVGPGTVFDEGEGAIIAR
jgi:serine/threonine protein kinase